MLDLEGGSKALLQLSAAVGLGYSITWLMRQQQLKKFEKIGTVKELVVYPVKSCQGVYVTEAECTQFGLRVNGVGDRHWMFVRDNNRFLSMRLQPQMALISVSISDMDITLDAPGMATLTLTKAPGNKSAVKQCFVWDFKVEGIDCGDTAAEWINKFLGAEGARLVHYSADLGKRFYARERTQWATTATQEDVTAFANWASNLLITESSLAALNKELPVPFDMRSFRPNIIISGPTAFDEDNWSDVRIGDKTQMRCIDARVRCVMTTVDPEKGIKREDGEPLKTLKRIRSSSYHKDGALLGMNLAPDICGSIKVGDPVYALRKTKK